MMKGFLIFSALVMAVCLIGCQQEEPAIRSSDNMLNGIFSVSATTKVRFSRGNLQYRASTDTWRFAEHQWDIVGMGYCQTDDRNLCYIGGTVTDGDNRQISSSYDGWIDLFGWATSGWDNTEDDPYAVNYNPWSILPTNLNVAYNPYGFGPSTNQPDTNLTGESANYDWGCNQIGEDAPRTWRTLTNDEWYYLLFTRKDAANKYGAAKVNGITGVVILSDDWKKPVACSFTAGMNGTGDMYEPWQVATSNIYSTEQWGGMENAGAVFLPCAGFRLSYPIYYGSTIYIVGVSGGYWSSTAKGGYGAYYLFFANSSIDPLSSDGRHYGRSVRLVSEL
ncbi:MAG: hypothetical protein J6Y00_01545 [Paludibacteraceae bacterium]|nr:hypothetical protein [Paludibacteraceae bacterium]